MSEVDADTNYQCQTLSAVQSQGGPYFNKRSVARVQALRELVLGSVAEQMAKDMNIEVPHYAYPEDVEAKLAQQLGDTEKAKELVAADQRRIKREATIAAIGAAITKTPDTGDGSSFSVGQDAVLQRIGDAKLTVDPRFEPFTMDLTTMPTTISGSLSVPSPTSTEVLTRSTVCFSS